MNSCSCVKIIMLVMLAVFGICSFGNTSEDTRINLLNFRDKALEVGTDKEDWQPAFVAALAEAKKNHAPLYVPAGEYKVQKAIDIPYDGEQYNPIRILGDGPRHSVIRQQNDEENLLNWSGPTYKKSFYYGSIKGVMLCGGQITINAKWHNYIKIEDCSVMGAKKYGILAEGWSSLFSNIVIRWCRDSGICGRAHFNNVIIRDCYIARCGTGIRLSGGHGVTITNNGFEHCANTAIHSQAMSMLSLSENYFEGNGESECIPQHLDKSFAYPSSIYLGHFNQQVNIEKNIFRVTVDGGGGCISIDNVYGGTIRENHFQLRHDRGASGVGILLKKCYPPKGDERPSDIQRLKVVDNVFCLDKDRRILVDTWYAEEKKGLLKEAMDKGCYFEAPFKKLPEFYKRADKAFDIPLGGSAVKNTVGKYVIPNEK